MCPKVGLVGDHECGGREIGAVVDDRGSPGAGFREGLAIPEAVVRGLVCDRVGVHAIEDAAQLPVDLHLEGHGDLAGHLEGVGNNDRGTHGRVCDLGARVSAVQARAEHQVVDTDGGDRVPVLHACGVLLGQDERAYSGGVLGQLGEPGLLLGGEGLVVGPAGGEWDAGQDECERQDQGADSGHE